MNLEQYYIDVYKAIQEPLFDFMSDISHYFDLLKRRYKHRLLRRLPLEYDLNYWTDKFQKIYLKNSENFIKLAIEFSKFPEKYYKSILTNLLFNYTFKYVIPISTYISRTNYKLLNKLLLKEKLTSEEVDRVLDFYNGYFRTQIIAITEGFRLFNYFYLYCNFYKGNNVKVFIAPLKNKCKKCEMLDRTRKYILDYFVVDNEMYLHPPIHVNNTALIYCYKE